MNAAVAALAMMLSSVAALQAQTAGARLARTRYVDPKGFFTVVPPENWRMQEYPQDPRGKVAFLGPEANVDFRVLVNAVDFSTIEDLVSFCKGLEGRLGFSTNILRMDFGGRPAVKRTFEARGIRFHYLDFLAGTVDHNLAFGAPPGLYDKHLPLVLKSMETYEPKLREASGQDVLKHAVAKKKRLAQLMLENGNLGLAASYVNEGLELAPKDPELLALKQQVEARTKKR